MWAIRLTRQIQPTQYCGVPLRYTLRYRSADLRRSRRLRRRKRRDELHLARSRRKRLEPLNGAEIAPPGRDFALLRHEHEKCNACIFRCQVPLISALGGASQKENLSAGCALSQRDDLFLSVLVESFTLCLCSRRR